MKEVYFAYYDQAIKEIIPPAIMKPKNLPIAFRRFYPLRKRYGNAGPYYKSRI